jgi:hypothetical protein
MTEERYNSGIEFGDWLKQVVARKEEWHANYRTFELTEAERRELSSISAKLNVFALTEDWCGDSIRNLTAIARIIEALPNASLRIFFRDLNLDLFEKFTPPAKRRIPTVVFTDAHFKPLAVWIEAPEGAEELKQSVWELEDGKQRYLEGLRVLVKKEIFSILREIQFKSLSTAKSLK